MGRRNISASCDESWRRLNEARQVTDDDLDHEVIWCCCWRFYRDLKGIVCDFEFLSGIGLPEASILSNVPQHNRPHICLTIPIQPILSSLQIEKNNYYGRFVATTKADACTIHSTISDKSTVCRFFFSLYTRSRSGAIVDDSRMREMVWLDLLESVNRESTAIIRLCGLNQLPFWDARRKLVFIVGICRSTHSSFTTSSPFRINGKSHSASVLVVTRRLLFSQSISGEWHFNRHLRLKRERIFISRMLPMLPIKIQGCEIKRREDVNKHWLKLSFGVGSSASLSCLLL